jgi:hypothetical protein
MTFDHDLRRAMLVVWMILSATILTGGLLLWLLPPQTVFAISEALQTPHPHTPCMLCGMTGAFVAISRGDMTTAMWLNPNAFSLFSILACNSLVFLGYVLYVSCQRLGRPTSVP